MIRVITAGMLLQAVGIGIVAAGSSFIVWVLAAVLLGPGTAMVYPTLLAVIGDVAHPTWQPAPSAPIGSGATSATPPAR